MEQDQMGGDQAEHAERRFFDERFRNWFYKVSACVFLVSRFLCVRYMFTNTAGVFEWNMHTSSYFEHISSPFHRAADDHMPDGPDPWHDPFNDFQAWFNTEEQEFTRNWLRNQRARHTYESFLSWAEEHRIPDECICRPSQALGEVAIFWVKDGMSAHTCRGGTVARPIDKPCIDVAPRYCRHKYWPRWWWTSRPTLAQYHLAAQAREGTRRIRRQPADYPLGHPAWDRTIEEHPKEYLNIVPLCTVVLHDGVLMYNAVTPQLCHASFTVAVHLIIDGDYWDTRVFWLYYYVAGFSFLFLVLVLRSSCAVVVVTTSYISSWNKRKSLLNLAVDHVEHQRRYVVSSHDRLMNRIRDIEALVRSLDLTGAVDNIDQLGSLSGPMVRTRCELVEWAEALDRGSDEERAEWLEHPVDLTPHLEGGYYTSKDGPKRDHVSCNFCDPTVQQLIVPDVVPLRATVPVTTHAAIYDLLPCRRTALWCFFSLWKSCSCSVEGLRDFVQAWRKYVVVEACKVRWKKLVDRARRITLRRQCSRDGDDHHDAFCAERRPSSHRLHFEDVFHRTLDQCQHIKLVGRAPACVSAPFPADHGYAVNTLARSIYDRSPYTSLFEDDVNSHDRSTQSVDTFCATLVKADHGPPQPSAEVLDLLHEEAKKYTGAVERLACSEHLVDKIIKSHEATWVDYVPPEDGSLGHLGRALKFLGESSTGLEKCSKLHDVPWRVWGKRLTEAVARGDCEVDDLFNVKMTLLQLLPGVGVPEDLDTPFYWTFGSRSKEVPRSDGRHGPRENPLELLLRTKNLAWHVRVARA